MQVTLKVVGGKNDGREIAISIPEFVIGRGDDAHLKPSSDLVSRRHCAVKVQDGKVIIQDMGSRNGTFVNGVQLKGSHVAKAGDQLRVGRLNFEVMIDHSVGGAKKPRVQGVVEAAARTANQKESSLEDSITDWLMDEGEDSQLDSFTRKARSNADTVQFNLEETKSIPNEHEAKRKAEPEEEQPSSELDADEESTEETEADGKKKKKKKKKEFGKLPPVPKYSHGDSTTAADDVLRKFFNRR